MKKTLSLLLVLILAFTLLAGCGASSGPKKIVVGASPVPHAEILAVAKEILKEKGYELEIKEFTDYIQPNLSLQSKDLDANFFQHTPYLNDFNAEQKTDLVPIASIHYEPLGVYPGKTKSLDGLKDGAQVAIPNDTTNEARALLLLETQGLIKLDPNADLRLPQKISLKIPRT